MRRVTNYAISKESFGDMIAAGRYNLCLEITFRDRTGSHRHKLGAWYSDEIHVYREYTETFLLTHNPRLGYVGLEVFNGAERVAEIFLEAHQVTEIFNSDDLAPFTMIRRLSHYVFP